MTTVMPKPVARLIAAGAWDADAMPGALRHRVAEIDCPEIDEIMNSTEGDEGVDDWWSWE